MTQTISNICMRARAVPRAIQRLGVLPFVVYLLGQIKLSISPRKTVKFRAKDAAYPLACRGGTSDRLAFSQVFVRQDYRPLVEETDVSLILDCGANVGYTAAYLLSKHPKALLIAIEPEDGNFQALSANLAPYGDRAVCLKAALWDRDCQVSVVPAHQGWEWATRVQPSDNGGANGVSARSIPSLLAEWGRRLSDQNGGVLLKVDIEGAEDVVFSATDLAWTKQIQAIAIELHSSRSEEMFKAVAHDAGWVLSRRGELTIGRREETSSKR